MLAPGGASARTCFGQAPGIVEGEERRPWRGRAGQTLRRWLELDEDDVLRDVLLRVGHALLPGHGRVGPRRPHADAARSSGSASSGASRSCALLRPRLIVTVGGLAARRLLGVDAA